MNILSFPVLIPFCRLIYYLIQEKEKKIKESMKIMGLYEGVYFTSWMLQYFVIFTIISAS
jgi:hypothetical protein